MNGVARNKQKLLIFRWKETMRIREREREEFREDVTLREKD
jgi:hypothetical protein